ncbi:hypothetical protein H8F24_13800 [Synechococcus sp. CBW1002]|uniref:hypothetical protein n=1 Tax=Synechococcus sp. CBW1002 TaxID=1353134 RepID=UPI0018CF5E90|nr:hypothetical protein [Synechococcus sp. CBW1002]QPN59148.1 hypothetical protein H8F24_13800 [Synechococcus sp. CBW1002]
MQLDSPAESAPGLPATPISSGSRSCCLDRQGANQAIAGTVIALIALLTSDDHIALPSGAAFPLPQQWGVWFIAASMPLVVVDAQLASGSRRRAAKETAEERERPA